MTTKILLALAFMTTSSALAWAQLPSGTGVTGGPGVPGSPSGVGVPGGPGPGNTTPTPNIPSMNPSNPTVGNSSGGSLGGTSGSGLGSTSGSGLTTSPSGLSTGGSTGAVSPSDPTAPPAGAPRIMVPERR
jgi:hypothetical protein